MDIDKRDLSMDDIYDPNFVADLFDRCSSNYRRWSAVSSFGFISLWRHQCVNRLPVKDASRYVIVDLMAGTGEVWPYLLRRFPNLRTITALDISHHMHIEADALKTDLPTEHADMIVSTFGLKTFNQEQQTIMANQIARMLKSGGHFSLIEASDPIGWFFRPVYRFYLDRLLPQIEKIFLKGAKDFSMIGAYTQNFKNCEHMENALRDAGLEVTLKKHFFGCATSVAGYKPLKTS